MKKLFVSLLAGLPFFLAAADFTAADCDFSIVRRHSSTPLMLKKSAPGRFVSGDLTVTVDEKNIPQGKEITLTFTVFEKSSSVYLLEVSAKGY